MEGIPKELQFELKDDDELLPQYGKIKRSKFLMKLIWR